MVDVMQTLTGGALYVLDIFLYVLIGLVFVAVLYFVFVLTKYNKIVIIRKIVNGRKIIEKDRAREFDDISGKYWKLFKRKKSIPFPPNKAIELTKKGKEFVEFYETDDGEFHPMIDKNDSINQVQPYTTNQRQLLKGQHDKAIRERGFRLQDHVSTIVNASALVIIVIALMVFYGDIAKPVLEQGKQLSGFQEKQNKMLDKQLEILHKYDELLDEVKSDSNGERRSVDRGEVSLPPN